MIARARATKCPRSHKRVHVDEGRLCASDKTFRAPEDPRVARQELAQVTFYTFLSVGHLLPPSWLGGGEEARSKGINGRKR